MSDYIVAAIEIQKSFNMGEIPDLDAYIALRMDSSRVYPNMGLIPYEYPTPPNSVERTNRSKICLPGQHT